MCNGSCRCDEAPDTEEDLGYATGAEAVAARWNGAEYIRSEGLSLNVGREPFTLSRLAGDAIPAAVGFGLALIALAGAARIGLWILHL